MSITKQQISEIIKGYAQLLAYFISPDEIVIAIQFHKQLIIGENNTNGILLNSCTGKLETNSNPLHVHVVNIADDHMMSKNRLVLKIIIKNNYTNWKFDSDEEFDTKLIAEGRNAFKLLKENGIRLDGTVMDFEYPSNEVIDKYLKQLNHPYEEEDFWRCFDKLSAEPKIDTQYQLTRAKERKNSGQFDYVRLRMELKL